MSFKIKFKLYLLSKYILSLAGRNSDDTVMGAGRPDKTNKDSPEALHYVKVTLALIRLALFLTLKLFLH